jgi:hypothetical protein
MFRTDNDFAGIAAIAPFLRPTPVHPEYRIRK